MRDFGMNEDAFAFGEGDGLICAAKNDVSAQDPAVLHCIMPMPPDSIVGICAKRILIGGNRKAGREGLGELFFFFCQGKLFENHNDLNILINLHNIMGYKNKYITI